MKRIFLVPLLFLAVHSRAQLFESQLADYNPAYTGMMDDRFADLSFSTFGLRRFFNYNNFNSSYQQNFDNINSGFGVNMGHARIGFEDFRLSTFYTSFSYRYALSFENGLRLSAGARLGYSRLDVSDNQQFGLVDAENFFFSIGGMASYRNSTLGIAVPIQAFGINPIVINASHKINLGERTELTLLSGSFLHNQRFQQNFRIKSEFNQKIWLTTGLIVVNDRSFYNNYVSYGLHMGYRIKQNFHVMLGTDFGFSSKSFSIYNPQIGLVYQWRK